MGAGRYRHLSFEEREQIGIWRLEGASQAEMARRLGLSSSTVNRELARNRLPSVSYQPSFAEGSYLARRERLERFVIDHLSKGWTPRRPSPFCAGLARTGRDMGRMRWRAGRRASSMSTSGWGG
jgi:transcriptional regulator with XRE-family HTH domain